MKKARLVDNFPDRGNHIGDKIMLPSGQMFVWTKFHSWSKAYK